MLPSDWRKQLQAVYPKRRGQGWADAGRKIEKHLKDGASFEEMVRGADNYRRHCAQTGEFVRMAKTFFGPDMWWEEFLDDDDVTNELTLDDEGKQYGLVRQPGEEDESFKRRIGVAMTRKMYG